MSDDPRMTDQMRLTIHEFDMSGVMLAVPLPHSLPDQLRVARPAKPMHVTLLYLGKAAKVTPEQAQALVAAARKVCASYGSLEGAIGDRFDSFPTGPDGTVPHWASVSLIATDNKYSVGADLHNLRSDLKAAIVEAGFPYDDTYPSYTPHVTIAFKQPGEPAPERRGAVWVEGIDTVELAYGPDAREAFAAVLN